MDLVSYSDNVGSSPIEKEERNDDAMAECCLLRRFNDACWMFRENGELA